MKKIFNKKAIISMFWVGIITILTMKSTFASGLEISSSERSAIYSSNSTVASRGAIIFQTTRFVIYAAAIIVVIIKGVQFMMASQDAEAKAKLKKELIAITIGAVLVFGIGSILGIIFKVSQDALGQ